MSLLPCLEQGWEDQGGRGHTTGTQMCGGNQEEDSLFLTHPILLSFYMAAPLSPSSGSPPVMTPSFFWSLALI